MPKERPFNGTQWTASAHEDAAALLSVMMEPPSGVRIAPGKRRRPMQG